MKLRTIVFWLHLTAGVLAGVVILIMSVTGVLLTFQQQVLRTVERSQRVVTPPALNAARLPADELLQRVTAAMPAARITALTLESDPAAAATAAAGPAGNLFVNPYTGEVLGSGSQRARTFYRNVTSWHRYLAMSGEAPANGSGTALLTRATGRAITGACNAAFLVLAMTGLYLWWPRQWNVRHLSPIIWFRRGLRGKPRDFNWHNTIGFWSAPVLIVLTASGMVISYAWAGNLVYTLTGSARPAPAPRAAAQAANPSARPGDSARSAATSAVRIEALLTEGARHLPTWRVMTLRLPARPGDTASITMSDTAHWNAFARSTLTLDAATGAVVRWDPYARNSLGQKTRGWLRFAHTGELFGLPGEAVAGLASAGGAFLVWTGLALSLRRLAAWRLRRRQQLPASVNADVGQLLPGADRHQVRRRPEQQASL